MAEYPPPTESLPIFDYSQFRTVTGAGLTQGEADALYLGRQGSVTSIASDTSFIGSVSCADASFINITNTETASFRDLQAYNSFITTTGTPSTFNGTANFNDTIVLPDGTTQTSAYTGGGAFAGSYTNTNLTVNSQGKITALASGSGGAGTQTLSQTLVLGNSAGATSINMNNNAITNPSNITYANDIKIPSVNPNVNIEMVI